MSCDDIDHKECGRLQRRLIVAYGGRWVFFFFFIFGLCCCRSVVLLCLCAGDGKEWKGTMYKASKIPSVRCGVFFFFCCRWVAMGWDWNGVWVHSVCLPAAAKNVEEYVWTPSSLSCSSAAVDFHCSYWLWHYASSKRCLFG